MDNHPKGWPLLYETPCGMIGLYGKVMSRERGLDKDKVKYGYVISLYNCMSRMTLIGITSGAYCGELLPSTKQ